LTETLALKRCLTKEQALTDLTFLIFRKYAPSFFLRSPDPCSRSEAVVRGKTSHPVSPKVATQLQSTVTVVVHEEWAGLTGMKCW